MEVLRTKDLTSEHSKFLAHTNSTEMIMQNRKYEEQTEKAKSRGKAGLKDIK